MFQVMGVVVSFGDEKAHDGHGQPADGVQEKDTGSGHITGNEDGGDMVHRHGNDGDEF